jgi:predicted aspartyl protease
MTSDDVSRFNPSAPVAEVTLRSPEGGRSVSDVLVLLDTGADVTLLPRRAIERLGIPPLPDRHYELMAFDGSTSFAPVVALDMVFLNRVFRGRYLLIEQEFGILGRDVLNHAVLLLDGPRQQWAEHAPSEPPAPR